MTDILNNNNIKHNNDNTHYGRSIGSLVANRAKS